MHLPKNQQLSTQWMMHVSVNRWHRRPGIPCSHLALALPKPTYVSTQKGNERLKLSISPHPRRIGPTLS